MAQASLRILLLGAGGREHALAWKLCQSNSVEAIFVVPGNSGTATESDKIRNIAACSPDDFEAVLTLVRSFEINFVIPTNEKHLVDGLFDFMSQGELYGI